MYIHIWQLKMEMPFGLIEVSLSHLSFLLPRWAAKDKQPRIIHLQSLVLQAPPSPRVLEFPGAFLPVSQTWQERWPVWAASWWMEHNYLFKNWDNQGHLPPCPWSCLGKLGLGITFQAPHSFYLQCHRLAASRLFASQPPLSALLAGTCHYHHPI